MSIDACQQFGLELAKFSTVTMKRIRDLSPSWQGVNNPVDIWPAYMVLKQSFTKVLTETLDAMLSDYEVDAVLLIWNMQRHQTSTQICELSPKLAEAHSDKPLVCCPFGAYAEETKNKLEASGRIMVTYTPDRAIRALSHLARYTAFRRSFQE